ncbi:MAG: HAMP domain-containing histidine kinase [Firmicutes bacterium]|nr:HAMP domain-containing histidine kinase [Bacillota bacterium]
MEHLWIGLLLLCLLQLGVIVYLVFRERNICRKIHRILSAILEEEEIPQSDLEEGPLSALSARANQLQETLMLEVHQAKEEKEQVKQLISNMSHQLKTPLANVMMYQEMLKDQQLTREQRDNFLQRMSRQSEKIDWILNSLFKMVRLEQNAIEFQVQPLPVKETILDAVGSVYEKAKEKQIAIELKGADSLKLLHNRRWTREVFENLLENAVKYTQPGGSITIEITTLELYTEIAFYDTGAGIAPAEYQAIFRRFYRGKNAKLAEGSGIGLYLTRLILEKENGYITVSPGRGSGSCFKVLLQNAPCREMGGCACD